MTPGQVTPDAAAAADQWRRAPRFEVDPVSWRRPAHVEVVWYTMHYQYGDWQRQAGLSGKNAATLDLLIAQV